MSKGKKVGFFFLGFVPFAAVLLWQVIVTYVGLGFYMVQQAGIDRSILNDMSRLLNGFEASSAYSITLFITYIGYAMFGLWYYLMFCKGKQTGNYKKVLKPNRILLIAVSGILLQVGIDMVLEIIFALFPSLMESYTAIMEALGSESIFTILCVCLLAPIGEELIFRGLTYRILRRAIPYQFAFVLQAILFGVYHLNPVQGVYAAVLGLILGYLAYRYESVLPGILLHIAINSSSYFAGYLLPEVLGDSLLWMSVVGLITTVIALLCIYIVGKAGQPAGREQTAVSML